MKLSLVIPVHNLEKYIEPMLVSLKYQVYDHREVEPIFICDSCTDRTHEIIENYLKASYPHLKVIDREYKSSGLSRNDGLEMATGRYIWLLDGDDWLVDNHAIKKIMRYFDENTGAFVLHVGFISNTYKSYGYRYTVWQWVFSAKWAKSVKFTSRQYDDDVEWVQRMMQKHQIFAYPKLEEPMYFYNYMREDSVMFKRKLEEFTK